MSNGIFRVPQPHNEPIKSYLPGSPERHELKQKLAELQSTQIEVPLIIGGEEVKTGNLGEMRAPHNYDLRLGVYHKAGSKWNLFRWISVRSIKETMVPPETWNYPFMEEE